MDLQQILIMLGVLALGVLIGHGVWSSRREKAQFVKSAQQFERQHRPPHSPQQAQASVYGQDAQTPHNPYSQNVAPVTRQPQQVNYGMAQQPMQQPVDSVQPMAQPSPYQTQLPLDEQETIAPSYEERTARSVESIKITLPNSTTQTQTNNVETVKMNASVQNSVSYEAPKESVAEPISQVEARAVYQQQQESAVQAEPEQPQQRVATEEQSSVIANEASQKKPDFIMLYVVAPENRQFYGVHIQEILEELGFIFGEYNIYHRHLDVNMVKSPIIFSVANMVQPGTFDPNNMENFSTIGLTLFMRLPSPASDIVNFRMLCRAAETLAEKLNGFVLNDKREIFDDNSRDRYLQMLGAPNS
ncbi:cell division protein ZipA [Gallibacterium anatis]|uniref:cell division protein ZipA n=1 Tax=Gallibacterium anatis TaxID=750 RepID=UPI00266F15E5|nr:cell division protein ZipA [Gallibacterium anatis]WKS98072.1 cell division protein ZipA [Gallibacterium anatis]